MKSITDSGLIPVSMDIIQNLKHYNKRMKVKLKFCENVFSCEKVFSCKNTPSEINSLHCE